MKDPELPPVFPDHPSGKEPPSAIGSMGMPIGSGGHTGSSPSRPPLKSPAWLATTVLVFVVMGLVMSLAVGRMVHEEDPVATSAVATLEQEVPVEGDGLVAQAADPPEDAAWSDARIRSAYGVAFDEKTDPASWYSVVDAPQLSAEEMVVLAARCGPVSPVIRSIHFTSSDDAYVRFRLVGSEVPGSDSVELSGGAVRRDGVWKVTGYTFDAVIGLADSACG